MNWTKRNLMGRIGMTRNEMNWHDTKWDELARIGTIVHPKATIYAISGPIVIGTGCIIEEATIIVNRYVCVLRCGISLFLWRIPLSWCIPLLWCLPLSLSKC